jgi:hypothetical protein
LRITNASVPIVFGSRLHLLYVFSGVRRQADVASSLHSLAAGFGYSDVFITEIDILKDPVRHDMLIKANKTNLMTRVYAGEFHTAFLTPACSSWSRVRFAPHGPKPVRNFSNPRGFPWLSGAQLKECTDANELVDLVIELAYAMHSIKGQYLIEHPEDLGSTKEGHMPASIWQLTAVRDLARETQAHTAAIFQCCPPGSVNAPGDIRKPTRFLGTASALATVPFASWPQFSDKRTYLGPLPSSCGHSHSRKLTATSRGQLRSASSAAYPPPVCRWIADVFLRSSRIHPPSGMGSSADHAAPQDQKVLDPGDDQGAAKPVAPHRPVHHLEQLEGSHGAGCRIQGRLIGEGDFTGTDGPDRAPRSTKGPVPLSEKLTAAALQVLRPHDRHTDAQQVAACRSISAGLVSDPSGRCTVSAAGFSCSEPLRRVNALVRQAVARLDITFRWSTLQINHAASCDWHTDSQGQAGDAPSGVELRRVKEAPKSFTSSAGGAARRVKGAPKSLTSSAGGAAMRVKEAPKSFISSGGGAAMRVKEAPKSFTSSGGGAAIIIGLGEYDDGLFQVEGEAPCSVASRALLFDPRISHRALPARGDKTTVVAYLHPDIADLRADDQALLTDLGFKFLDCALSDTSDDDEDGHRRIKLGTALQGRPPPPQHQVGRQAPPLPRWGRPHLALPLAVGRQAHAHRRPVPGPHPQAQGHRH